MNKLFVTIAILFFGHAYAQNKLDEFKASNGVIYHVGDTLSSLNCNDCIEISSTAFSDKYEPGTVLKITKILKKEDEVLFNAKGGVNNSHYTINIELAIKNCRIIPCKPEGEHFSSAIIIDSLESKSQIFSKSLLWVAKNWKNPKEVIQMQDESDGVLIIVGAIAGGAKGRISIRCKDGKAKIEITDVSDNISGTILTLNGIENPTVLSKRKWAQIYSQWLTDITRSIELEILTYKHFLLTKPADF